MRKANPNGFHTTLDRAAHARIIECIERVLTPRQVARLARVHPNNLLRWLKRGFEDCELGNIDTPFAQLWADFEERSALQVEKFLLDIIERKQGWQAVHELVKALAPEDFGKDSEIYKHLLEDYKQLLNDLVELKKGKK